MREIRRPQAVVMVLAAAVGGGGVTWATMDAVRGSGQTTTVLVPVAPGSGASPSRHWADCEPAPTGLALRVASRPVAGATVRLRDARLVGAADGDVLVALVEFESPQQPADTLIARWHVTAAGGVTAFDEEAASVTSWPRDTFAGITTGTTMVVEDCADRVRAGRP